MRALSALVVALAACTALTSSTPQPVITGDRCEVYATRSACEAHPECGWSGPLPCPGSGSSDTPACTPDPDSGTCSQNCWTPCVVELMSGCACEDDQVCFEQLAGATSPEVECILPAPGDGDPCARIEGEGTCRDSDTVAGLCICDHGTR